MRLRVVRANEDLPKLNPNEKMVYLTFRPTTVDLVNLMVRCPGLEAVQVSPHCRRRLSLGTCRVLEAQGIDLLVGGDTQKYKSKTGEYIMVDEAVIEEIREMVSDGVDAKKIVTRLEWTARLAPDLIRYIIKTSI